MFVVVGGFLSPLLITDGLTSAPFASIAVPQNVGSILDDVVARLVATGAFGPDDGSAEAAWGNTLDALFPDAISPSAAVEYLGSTETTIADWDFMVRDGRYTLTLAVRDPDPRTRGNRLDQLANMARNALSGVSLAGLTQPFFTRLKEDSTATASLPEGRLVLNGSFRFTIEDDESRDETDND